MSIVAVIPVRKGSARVKNKNIKPFAGSSLLKIKIEQIKKLKGLDDIVVSSDCEEMLQVARELSVKTHVRDAYYASSEASNSEFFKNLAESIEAESLMYSPVTCPLVSVGTYRECIQRYKTKRLKNLVTVSPVKHHMWLGDTKPLNYKINDSPNSQDLPNIFKITYGACIIRRDLMLECSNVVTENPFFHVLDEIESIDIDSEFDFMVAEMVYERLYESER